ncbi:MAG: LLM class flavin-dependent oxidoreductase [Candidatus Thorarchaeota archaeon]|nr:LLM class flavin-dependent oxidoreductase [Candidatus Thorarchaeota archaeon]
MKGFKEFGVAMTGLFPVREAVDLAVTAERLGIGSVWFAEDYFFRGGIPYMAAAAMATEKIRIGLGVVNPYSRHPALIAMEFATLDEMSNMRTVFGLGSGVPYWMSQMGFSVKKPISKTRACVNLVRKIMTGELVNHQDKFFEAKDVQLIFKPVRPNPPIYLAFEGKQGLALSGEIGDGSILSIFNTPSYVKFAWERIKIGAEKSGKDLSNFEMVSYLPMVVDDDLDKAISITRDFMKLYLAHSQTGGPLMKHAGISDEETLSFRELESKGKDFGHLITDSMVQSLGIVGNVESCLKQIQEIVDAGVNTPVLFPVPGINVIETVTTIAEEIVPHLK